MGLYENKNGVLSQIAGRGNIDGVYKAQGILGAKNLFNFDTQTVTSQGVTFENIDGVITANGTAGSEGFPYIECRKTIPAGTYILTGCPSGGGDVAQPNNYQIILRLNDPAGQIIALDYGEGYTFTLDQSSVISMRCMTSKDMTVTNLIFKPMIRLAYDNDSTYQPYAMTNKELTEDVDGIKSQMKQTEFISGEIARLVTNSLRGTTGSNRVIHFDFRGDGIGILTWRSNNANSVYLVSNKEGTFSATKISGTDLTINSADLSDVTITSGQGGIICAVHCVASTWAYKSNSY